MTVTSAQVTTLLENVLFESATLAAANAPSMTAIANFSANTSTVSGLSSFLASTAEASIAQQVVRYYQGALGRVPSPSEIAFYVNYAETGLTASQIATGASAVPVSTWNNIANFFANSTEFKTDFGLTGGLTAANEAIVITGFYNNILGRAPTSSEISFYVNALNSGGATPTTLVQFFTNSPEYQATANATIQTNLANAGTTAVTTAAAGGNPLASTAPIGSLPTPPVTVFNLTSGVDTGSASSFNAVLSATAANNTLNSFDKLTGTTGSSNTLNITSDGTKVPAGVTVTNIQTVVINSTGDQSADVSSWNGVTALNITQTGVSTGAAASVVAGSGVAISDTGVLLANGAAAANATALSIDGGSTVTATVTATDGGSAVGLENIVIGGSTAPTGAVTLTATETYSKTGTSVGNITVTGGGNVTVSSTLNGSLTGTQNLAANAAGTPTANDAGLLTVSGKGVITVNSTLNITDKSAHSNTYVGDTISVSGGTSAVINDTVTATSGAVSVASIASATDGAVNVTDGGTLTSVTINQTKATAKAYAGPQAATASSTTAGGAGYSAVTTAGTAGSAAKPGTLGVAAGVVQIGGASIAAETFANASTTITTVALDNFASGSFINSSALTSLTLADSGGTLNVDNLASTPLTSLTLNLNKFSDASAITGQHFTTLNVVTGGSGASSLNAWTDTSLTTLNVSGTQSLTLSTINSSLTKIAVTGAAGFSDGATAANAGVAAIGSALAVTTSSSGTIAIALDDTTQTFTGSTGTDKITIAAHGDASKTITAGSATNNELILDGTANAAYNLTATTAGKVTGFQVLGVNANVTGTIDVGVLGSSFKSLDVIGASTIAFTDVAQNSAITLEGAANTVSVTYADAAGANDAVTLTLGTASNTTAHTVTSLTVKDANSVGIGTLNVVSNASSTVNTIATLVDNGLSHLNVTGTGGLTITTLNEATTQATSFSINNKASGTVTITTFTDNNLGSLNFSGTHASVITALNDSGHVIGITNTGSSSGTVTTLTDNSLTTLTLGSGVTLGKDSSTIATMTGTGLVSSATTGVTISGSGDNAHVVIDLSSGAAAGNTDTITLGNGNDYITDASTAGTVKITVGTGSNYIVASSGGNNATYSASITLGTHTSTSTANDYMLVSVTGSQTAGYSTVITGAAVNDQVAFGGDAAQSVVLTFSSTQLSTIAGSSTLANALTTAYTDLHGLTGHAAHEVAAFVYGGNTYVINSVGDLATFTAGTDSVVEIVGSHTIAQVTAAGHATFSIAS